MNSDRDSSRIDASPPHVGVLRPPFGCAGDLSPALVHAGIEALSTALRDPDIRVIVLGGGADALRLPLPPRLAPEVVDALHDWVLALADADKPTIAAVDGEASGAGLALALGCDMLVASRRARLVPDPDAPASGWAAGALWFAARRLPRPALLAWALEGRALGASEAAALGLACRVAEPGQALEQALALATTLAAADPSRLAQLRRRVDASAAAPLHHVLADERALILAGR